MAAAGGPSEFRALLAEHHYATRAKKLFALGKSWKEQGASGEELRRRLEALGPKPSCAFENLAVLTVARGAGATGFPVHLLDHQSQAVRRAAVESGLLTSEQAKDAFLSSDSSRQVKSWLLKSWTLPYDDKVMQQANHLFGSEAAWRVLIRTKDAKVFEEGLKGLGGAPPCDCGAPAGMLVVAQKFPEATFRLLEQGMINAGVNWGWFERVIAKLPDKVLNWYFSPKQPGGQQGKASCMEQAMLSWGWRHVPETMKDLCLQCAGSASPKHGVLKLVTALMDVHSTGTGFYLTANQKMTLLVEVFSQLPQSGKTPDMAQSFVTLLPKMQEHRAKEINNLIEAWWKVIAELGRLQRKDALQWKDFSIFKSLASRLPPPLAVSQFMKLLAEVEPSSKLYQYMQSDICTTDDGTHDLLMGQVFDQFLCKDVQPKEYVQMFSKLLGDCKSMDVIQPAFDSLVWRLGNTCEHGLLVSVVDRMLQLQRAYAAKAPKEGDRKDGLLPIPEAWLQFAKLPEKRGAVSAYVEYLHLTLHSGAGPDKLLGSMMARYGRAFFFDAFAEVLLALGAADGGSKKRALLTKQQPPDLNAFSSLEVSRIESLPPPPTTRHASTAGRRLSRQGSSVKPSATALAAGGGYFDKLEEAKKDTFGKCPIKRESGYMSLVKAAGKDKDPKAFEDLLPFLSQRLNAEQDNIRANVIAALLDQDSRALPVELWCNYLTPLEALFKASTKNLNIEFQGPRHMQQKIWERAATELLSSEFKTWQEGQGASPSCLFALSMLEVLVNPSQDIWKNLTATFAVAGTRAAEKGQGLSRSAAGWVFEKSMELIPDAAGRLERFFPIVEALMKGVPDESKKLRLLWADWPFLANTWRKLLGESVSQKCSEWVLVGCLSKIVSLQNTEAYGDHDAKKVVYWFAPLEVAEYDTAVQGSLKLIADRDIPPQDASRLLTQRIESLVQKELMVDGEFLAPPAMDNLNSIYDYKGFKPQKVAAVRLQDDYVAREVAALRGVLLKSSAADRRPVLWSVAQVTEYVRGPAVSAMLEDAIGLLDADVEGKARCIAHQFPFLELALSRGPEQLGCDVLSPLLEAWLSAATPKVVEERVQKLMGRKDAHAFLFFGFRFAEFLSNYRQDWLHKCLERLTRPDCGVVEFYHYTERGIIRVPWVGRLALFGKGWDRYAQQHMCKSIEGVQTKMWHRDTQALFLDRALQSTDFQSLNLLARLDFTDCTVRAAELLEKFPKPQEGSEPDKGFVIVQPTGNCEDLTAEIERRFMEIPAPGLRNAVEEQQLEQILTALGFADNSIQALTVLGEYAGKVKRAKDAVIRAVPNLSPKQARVLVRDVMLGPKAGVSLCVAAIRTIADLQMPDPMELYKAAWRDGKCHRDIAANILSRLATSPLVEFTAESAQPFFNFFTDASRTVDHKYVGELLLNALQSADAKNQLPFMPSVVLTLASFPGLTRSAVGVFGRGGGDDTEVMKALTSLLQHTRFAHRARSVTTASKERPAVVLTDIAEFHPSKRSDLFQHALRRANDCSVEALQSFVQELSHCVDTDSVTKDQFFELWVRTLRGSNVAAWPGLVAEMERWILSRGNMTLFKQLTKELDGHLLKTVAAKTASGDGSEHRPAALAVLVQLHERILDTHLAGALGREDADASTRTALANGFYFEGLAKLLARGCAPQDFERVLARCPKQSVELMASSVLKFSLEVKAPCRAGFDALVWGIKTNKMEVKQEIVGGGAKLVARGHPGSPSFEELVDCLSPLRVGQSTHLVRVLMEEGPTRNVGRAALKWLSTISAATAVDLYPKLLELGSTPGKPEANPHLAGAEDVEALLGLCKAASLDLPAVRPRSCPLAALPQLAASELPAARLLAVQVIQERELVGERPLLGELLADACLVVRLSAEHVRAALFGDEAAGAGGEGEEEMGDFTDPLAMLEGMGAEEA